MRRRLGMILTVFLLMAAISPSMAADKKQNFGTKQSAQVSGPAGEWLRYYKGGAATDFGSISHFVSAHPDFPAMNKIRNEAERVMPSDYPDAKIITWFSKNPPQSTRGMKLYVGALQSANQMTTAKKAVNEWWKTASLTRPEQQDGYTAFSKMIDRVSHEHRLRVLIYREQYTNARAIALLLGPGYSALTETRISLKSGKGSPDHYIKGVPASLMGDEGLQFDRLRYRRKADNNSGAIDVLNQCPASDEMYSSEEWGKERGIIVRRLFEEGKYSQAYRLSANHRIKNGPGFAQNEWMAGWIALDYLNKPWDAFEHFERLYHTAETPISKSRAAYWAGLASEKLNHPEIARKWYTAGSKFSTTFYGQLSGEKIGGVPPIRHSGVSGSASVKSSAMAQAARTLKNAGYRMEAGMFITKMIEVAKTPGDYAGVAEVANAIDMKNYAIKAAQESEKKTGVVLVSYAFPKVEKYLGGVESVEWALVHALIRQESRYDDQAVSTAGARGLMQLMPATAKEVATKAGISHQTDWLTGKPAHNINLGSRYLRRMLDRYNGNYAMALAAYNAGPGRVDRWVKEMGDPRDPKVDLINWIETIPIYETRNYVQRVLEGVEVYRQTLSSNKNKPSGQQIHLANNDRAGNE